jgi:hypothetical protein
MQYFFLQTTTMKHFLEAIIVTLIIFQASEKPGIRAVTVLPQVNQPAFYV